MNISTSTVSNQNTKLPSFIKLHIRWTGLADTPEWQSFVNAWTAGEYHVTATALDVIRSHYREELSRPERNLLCGISDSLVSAIHSVSSAA